MTKDAIHDHNSAAPGLHFVLPSSFCGVPHIFLDMTIYRKEPRGADKFSRANLLLNAEGTNSYRQAVVTSFTPTYI